MMGRRYKGAALGVETAREEPKISGPGWLIRLIRWPHLIYIQNYEHGSQIFAVVSSRNVIKLFRRGTRPKIQHMIHTPGHI